MADTAVETRVLSEEDRSKDAFFGKIAQISDAMIAAHGRDFAMGALILAARFIADRQPLSNRTARTDEKRMAAAKSRQ
jgi:hypothetical protein